jgi:benzodiazapine receptor
MSKYASLAVFAGLTVLASLVGSQFMPDAWYAQLAKPSWTPPKWLFGPVWTVLYVMIALAGWFAWRALGFGAAALVWGVQMALNASWSYLMFGRKDIAMALVDIAILWLAIIAFIALTFKPVPKASGLFVPYALWVSFAAALNFAVWQLNA